MKLVDHVFEVFLIDLCIDFRAFNVLVAEDVLDIPDAAACPQEVVAQGVPEMMAGHTRKPKSSRDTPERRVDTFGKRVPPNAENKFPAVRLCDNFYRKSYTEN